jgi:hypothetical protein
VLRFRRSRGDERQQLKWLTYVVAVEVVMLPALGRAAEQWAPLLGELVVFPVAVSLIPIAIGVAVLKYRLYDIDRVIKPRPWPWPRCFSRLAAAFRRWWIDASTAAAMTRPGRSRPSAGACATRSSWTPSQPSYSRWWIKPCGRPLYRSGSNQRHRRAARTEKREQINHDAGMTPCMPCTFSALHTPRSGAIIQLGDSPGLTVVVRWIRW